VKKLGCMMLLAALGFPYTASAAAPAGQAKLPLVTALLGGGNSLGVLPALGKALDGSSAGKASALPGLAQFNTSFKAQNASLPPLSLNLNGILTPLDGAIQQFSLKVISPAANMFLPQILLLPSELTDLLPGSPALVTPLADDAFILLAPAMKLVPILTPL
jgi:hypothetical protein